MAGVFILGLFVILGLAALGHLLANAAIEYKQYDRSVTVKGVSGREFAAGNVIWPIQFAAAGNDIGTLYASIEKNTAKIVAFLTGNEISAEGLIFASPAITDKSAQQYGGNARP